MDHHEHHQQDIAERTEHLGAAGSPPVGEHVQHDMSAAGHDRHADHSVAMFTIEHDGRNYAFCRSGCLQSFQEEPVVYAAKAEQAHAITVPQSAGCV